MLYASYNSSLPVFERTAFKLLNDGTYERINEIETDAAGNVIRVQVKRVYVSLWGADDVDFKSEYRDYKSKSWITRIMREYAHLVAKSYTARLF